MHDQCEKLIPTLFLKFIQAELNGATQECSSLSEKVRVQRETAASSLNRIQKQSQEKCNELHTKVQELSGHNKEVGNLGLKPI